MTIKSRIIKSLIKRELVLTVRRLDQFLLPLLFNCLLFFIALFLLDKFSLSREKVIYTLFLMTSIITLGFSKNLSLEEDFKRGILERFCLLPIKGYYLVLLKGFLSLVTYLVMITVFYWIVYFFFLDSFWSFYYKLIIINFYLALITFALKLISLKVRGQFFVTISLIILTFPEIIITLLALDQEVYLLLLIALIIVFLPLVLFFLYLIFPNLVKN